VKMETPNTEAIGPDQITTEHMEKAVDWLDDLAELSTKFKRLCEADLVLVGATIMVAAGVSPEEFLKQVQETYAAIEPLVKVPLDETSAFEQETGAEKRSPYGARPPENSPWQIGTVVGENGEPVAPISAFEQAPPPFPESLAKEIEQAEIAAPAVAWPFPTDHAEKWPFFEPGQTQAA
jgi:hypothetical protein